LVFLIKAPFDRFFSAIVMADRLTKMLGKSGSQVIMRLAAFVNLLHWMEIVWHGVQGLMG